MSVHPNLADNLLRSSQAHQHTSVDGEISHPHLALEVEADIFQREFCILF